MMPTETELPLREAVQSALPALPDPLPLDEEGSRIGRKLRERLRRDLLPRLSSTHPTLLAGIAGPNNVGKSSLFNAFLQRHLSPARAEGGLTKQCLAAAHPAVWEGELRQMVEQRYDVVRVETAEQAPVTQEGPPGRLYLLLDPRMPRGVLLMDTPDFDSIYLGNRVAAEALLVTVDVLFFLVSRPTYQNAALVQFLKEAIGNGRPYVLIYNEATRQELAAEHLRKLAQDVGQPPVGLYFATHQPEVELGEQFLKTQPLSGGPPLEALLVDPSHRQRLKAAALAASLRDACTELGEVAAGYRRRVAEPDRLRSRIRHELVTVGEHAARHAVPAATLVIAFQDELDARSAFNRVVRRQVRRFMSLLTVVGRKVRESFVGTEAAQQTVVTLTDSALRDALRKAIDALSHEVSAWRGDPQTRLLLQSVLGPEMLERLNSPLTLHELARQEDQESLYSFCRELVSKELSGSGREQFLQAATTLVYSLPVGAAGALTLATGGMGHDAVVWVTAAVSTPVLEKLVDLLGSGMRDDVTRRWAQEHGRSLGAGLERELFAPLLQHLDALVGESEQHALVLESAQKNILSTLDSRTS